MRKLFLFIVITFAFSCHKNSPQPTAGGTVGALNFKITNKFNGKNLVLNQKYITAQGDSFYIINFKYYISNIEFMNLDNGAFYAAPNSYYLVDASNPASATLEVTNIPPGDYNQFAFSIGVDDVRNHTGAQTGALDATVNADMFWSWSAGYKFLVLEGYFLSAPGSYSPFLFHIGSDDNYKNLNFSSYSSKGWNTDINIQAGKTSEVDANFNIDSIFVGINLDSAYNDNIQGGGGATIIANNYTNMPQLTNISNP